jgi:hypothetical protein
MATTQGENPMFILNIRRSLTIEERFCFQLLFWSGTVVAFAVIIAIAIRLRSSDNPIKPGGTVSEIEFDSLTGFDCETDRWRLSAHRWRTGQAYRIVHEVARSGAFEHCIGNARFEQALRGLLLLRANRQLSSAEVKRLTPVTMLIRYSIGLRLEPFEAFVTFDASGHAVLRDGEDAYQLQLTKSQLSDLEQGCNSLAKGD